MKQIIAVLLAFLTTTCPIFSQIIETAHFRELLDHVTPDTLVILDIDDTLLIPVQMLGCDEWFMHRLKTIEASGLPRGKALDRALAEWEAIRHLTKMEIVEEGSDQIVQQLQNQGYTVMGLTTQGLALATRTVEQLKLANINLFKTAPSSVDHYFINGHGVLYRKGILFTAGTPKGPALVKLLDLMGVQPKRIVFINDKATHLADVEGSVEQQGIEFTGLRYSYSDARKAKFSVELSSVQFALSTFEHILSDAEAKEVLPFYRNLHADLDAQRLPVAP